MVKHIENRINQAIEKKVFPGCVIGIVKKDGHRMVLPFGRYTYDEHSPTVLEDSIYDVASITKSIPTSSLALKLIEEGRLRIEDRLITYVPEFANPDREEVLIRHLLTQTLDYGFRLSSYKNKDPEEIMKIVYETPFNSEPGTVFYYTNATSILLGMVVERIYNKSLDTLSEDTFFKPLNMKKTTFHPLKHFNRSDIVPTELDSWRGRVIQGEVHDESAFKLRRAVGSAGLFSTVPDLLNFLEMLLNSGVLNNKHYFSEKTLQLMYTNQLRNIGEYAGLGWELNQPHYMGHCCKERTFGKTGFTGCVVICDIEREIGIAFLSNCTFPRRKSDNDLVNQIRREISDIILTNIRYTLS